MCLRIAVELPDHVLNRGEVDGYEWVVVHNGLGHRCGYFRVPAGHPWHGKDYDEVPAHCHGELTFGEPDFDCKKGRDENGYWFGFDTAHCFDAADPELPTPRDPLREFVLLDPRRGGVVRSQAYVEGECFNLIAQAKAAAAVPPLPA